VLIPIAIVTVLLGGGVIWLVLSYHEKDVIKKNCPDKDQEK